MSSTKKKKTFLESSHPNTSYAESRKSEEKRPASPPLSAPPCPTYASIWKAISTSIEEDQGIRQWWATVREKEVHGVWQSEAETEEKTKYKFNVRLIGVIKHRSLPTGRNMRATPKKTIIGREEEESNCFVRLLMFLLGLTSTQMTRFCKVIQTCCLEEEIPTQDQFQYYALLQKCVADRYFKCIDQYKQTKNSDPYTFEFRAPWIFLSREMPVLLDKICSSFLPNRLFTHPPLLLSRSTLFLSRNIILDTFHLLHHVLCTDKPEIPLVATGVDLVYDVLQIPRTTKTRKRWRRYDIYHHHSYSLPSDDSTTGTISSPSHLLRQMALQVAARLSDTFAFRFAYWRRRRHHRHRTREASRPQLFLVFSLAPENDFYVLLVIHAAPFFLAVCQEDESYCRANEKAGCLGFWACSTPVKNNNKITSASTSTTAAIPEQPVVCFSTPSFREFFQTGIQPIWSSRHGAFLQHIIQNLAPLCSVPPTLVRQQNNTARDGQLVDNIVDSTATAAAIFPFSDKQDHLATFFHNDLVLPPDPDPDVSSIADATGPFCMEDWMEELGATKPVRTCQQLLQATQHYECLCHDAICTADDAYCPICLNALCSRYLRLFCGHYIHADCFFMYVCEQRNTRSDDVLCPICKQSVTPIDENCVLDCSQTFPIDENEEE